MHLFQARNKGVAFLTRGKPNNDEVVMSLWHPRLTLLVVTFWTKGLQTLYQGWYKNSQSGPCFF